MKRWYFADNWTAKRLRRVFGQFFFFNKKKDTTTTKTEDKRSTDSTTVAENTTPQVSQPAVPEVVPSTTTTNITNETLTAQIPQIIKDYYQLAESRSFDNLYDLYLSRIERYYGKTYPSRAELETLFSKYYATTSNSFHNITNIQTTSFADYTEAIVTLNYSYFVIKTQEQKYQSDIKVRFVFNKSGQIKSIAAL